MTVIYNNNSIFVRPIRAKIKLIKTEIWVICIFKSLDLRSHSYLAWLTFKSYFVYCTKFILIIMNLRRLWSAQHGCAGMAIQNIGFQNIGIQNIGNQNIGIQNIGIQNKGIQNRGIQNIGIQNIGIQNIGNHNIGIQNIGIKSLFHH